MRVWLGDSTSDPHTTPHSHISNLGLGITKVRKVTRGAVVVGCESKSQADKLKEKAINELGDKYEVRAPRKKNLKLRIFDVDKEDCENDNDFWNKIKDQNGIDRASIEGKIINKSSGINARGTTLIVEVNATGRDKILETGKLKIGWNICKVQEYIGLLRCYKCCGFYHIAKDCNKQEVCGNCAEKHTTKECKNPVKKCVNCEEKINVLKIKNITSNHSAYDSNCACYKRDIEKQRNKILCNL